MKCLRVFYSDSPGARGLPTYCAFRTMAGPTIASILATLSFSPDYQSFRPAGKVQITPYGQLPNRSRSKARSRKTKGGTQLDPGGDQ